jgi:RimJ/RimL family protein N-acetyltransferase
MNVRLRAVTPEDCERTFGWANDPATRAASFRSAPIERAEHERWFRGSLDSPVRALLIAELEGAAIAVVRFDYSESNGTELSLTLAPERRGQGLSLPVLQAAVRRARNEGLARLVARIRPANERSIRSFTRAGFQPCGREEVAGQEALRYELRLEPRESPTTGLVS